MVARYMTKQRARPRLLAVAPKHCKRRFQFDVPITPRKRLVLAQRAIPNGCSSPNRICAQPLVRFELRRRFLTSRCSCYWRAFACFRPCFAIVRTRTAFFENGSTLLLVMSCRNFAQYSRKMLKQRKKAIICCIIVLIVVFLAAPPFAWMCCGG